MQANLQFRAVSSTIAFSVFALVAYILVCTRVPQPTANNTDIVSGRVVNVVDGGVEDVIITLADDDRTYYINRGLERGVNLNRFAQQLEGKQVELRVIRRMWSPLDPYNRLAPVGRVTLGEEILFTDF